MSGKASSHKSCCIPKCRLTAGKLEEEEEKKISYHTFPFDETESLSWLKSICAADKSHIELFPNSRVCSRHFVDTDYIPNQQNGRIRLKPGAVPTVFEWTSMENGGTDETTCLTSDEIGFTVHIARKNNPEDISAMEAAVASNALVSNLNTGTSIDLRSNSNTGAGIDLTATSNAFIALQSPQRLAMANNVSSTPSMNNTSTVELRSRPMEVTPESAECPNCDALEAELSRASVELTNLQREKMLLHAKCAELEDEVQKIHAYCKQLKALNEHLQMVNAVEREEKAKRAMEAELAAVRASQQNHNNQPELSPQSSLPQIALQQMANGGKGRRKQSNPMKRPREEGGNSDMVNGDNSNHSNGSLDADQLTRAAKVPALDESGSAIESTDASTQTTIEGNDISGLKDENDLLSGVLTDERRLHRTLFVKSILTTNENVKTFTGIPTKEGLEILFEVLMDPEMMNLHWQARPGDTLMAAQKKAYLSVNRRGMSSLSPFHDFLITLIRLNLGLKHVVLSSLFGCSTAKTSTVCRSWIEYMRGVRENTMIGKLLAHLPLDVQKSERVEQHMISLPPLVSETQWISICRSFLDRHKNLAATPETVAAVPKPADPQLSPGTSLGLKVKECKTGAGLVLENYHSQIKREHRKSNAQLNAAIQNTLPPLAIKQEPGLPSPQQQQQQQLFNPNMLANVNTAAAAAAQGFGNNMMYLLANGCVVQDYSKLALTVPQFQNQLLPFTSLASIPPSLQALAQVGSTPTIDLSEATAAAKVEVGAVMAADEATKAAAGAAAASTEDLARAFGIESVGGLIQVAKNESEES